jgi:hypothetical protein
MVTRCLLFLPAVWADTGSAGGGEAPVADAGLGLLAYVGDTVELNGTASYDPEDAELGYFWSQSGGPEVGLVNGDEAKPSFTIEAPGTYRFDLVVNDGYQDSEADTVEIVVAETRFGGEAEGSCAAWPGASPGAATLAVFAGLACLRRARR